MLLAELQRSSRSASRCEKIVLGAFFVRYQSIIED